MDVWCEVAREEILRRNNRRTEWLKNGRPDLWWGSSVGANAWYTRVENDATYLPRFSVNSRTEELWDVAMLARTRSLPVREAISDAKFTRGEQWRGK